MSTLSLIPPSESSNIEELEFVEKYNKSKEDHLQELLYEIELLKSVGLVDSTTRFEEINIDGLPEDSFLRIKSYYETVALLSDFANIPMDKTTIDPLEELFRSTPLLYEIKKNDTKNGEEEPVSNNTDSFLVKPKLCKK